MEDIQLCNYFGCLKAYHAYDTIPGKQVGI